MNKSELDSKHLSDLHALAAEAGVDGYRMLPRAELIEKLADGSSGSGSGSGGGGRSGQGERSRGGRERSGGGSRGGSGGGRGGRGGERSSRGGGRGGERSGGGGERSGREGRPPRDRSRRKPAVEKAELGNREAAPPPPAPEPPAKEGERPKRRRRRRFGRRGGKTVRAHEMLMPGASGRQVLVYAESREACTSLLRELAADLSGGNGPDPVALLIDPSPEELAEWKREAPKAEIVSAGQERHAEDALAQAVRRAESGEGVVFLVDSLSRFAEEFGGAKEAKELFDGGLAAGGSGGSLTVIAAVERSAGLAPVGDAAPGGLFGELDQILAAVRLDVAEGLGALVEDDVELPLLDALVEPGAAEDEPAQPVDEAAVGGADQLLPVLVDVLAESGAGLGDLAADGEVEEVVELLLAEALGDEAEFHCRLLDALPEVLLVEGKAQLAVLQNVVGARLVVTSAGRLLIHVS